MTRGRDIAAESIGDLLEVARTRQRSGLLRAECAQNGRLEEGEIYLLAGQPIYARAGRLAGVEALNYVLSWRNIYFSFVSDVPRPPANIFSGLRPNNMTTPLDPDTRTLTPPPFPVTGGLRRNERSARATVPPRESTTGIEHLIPQKSDSERDVFSLGLTRRQRLIYFMVDGQRAVADLARTTNKTVLEVELVLGELQELGLVVL